MANLLTIIFNLHRLLTLINEFTKGINSSTPQAFFSHKTFALLIAGAHEEKERISHIYTVVISKNNPNDVTSNGSSKNDHNMLWLAN